MNEKRESLSIIIPAYNEAGNVQRAAQAVREIMEREHISAAIYFVDDGSKDGTWEEINELARTCDMIRGVRFSRNFGKEAAIFAGLEAAAGDCCAVMDCDLQHPPETLVEMYRLWESGYEVIEGVKDHRGKENILYKGMSLLFYKLMTAAVGMDMARTSDFKLLDRKAVDAITAMPERITFFRALSEWVGFKSVTVGYRVGERQIGESKWSTWGLIRYAVRNITAFTTAPLALVTWMGILFLLVALYVGINCIIDYVTGAAVAGFTTVILVELIIGAVVMMSLGIIGGYIAKIYNEVKGRQRYIVSTVVGMPGREKRPERDAK